MTWLKLKPGSYGASTQTPGIDSNLVWADASDFVDFRRIHDRKPMRIPVVLHLRQLGAGRTSAIQLLRRELRKLSGGIITPVYLSGKKAQETHFCTAIFNLAYCKEVLRNIGQTHPKVGAMIDRFELQLPVLPKRARIKKTIEPRVKKLSSEGLSEGRTLVGIVDFGIPFASRSLRDLSGVGTRVLAIWDQDDEPAFATRGLGGFQSSKFGYGCEIRRAELNTIMTRNTFNGVVSEDSCYEEAGCKNLRRRIAHGAAVVDLLAGPLSFFARSVADPDSIPSWAIDPTELVHKADVAFVQLPRDAVQDSSSASLTRLLLDGLRYIVSLAGKDTRRIVVNISDGSFRGSHDGSSIFELSMEDLVREQSLLGRKLVIVLAAGNSRNEMRHAQLGLGPQETVTIRLPPGCETAAQLFIRIPEAAKNFKLSVTAPGDHAAPVSVVAMGEGMGWYDSGFPTCSVVVPNGISGRPTCALIAWSPTVSAGTKHASALAGDWKISVSGTVSGGEDVHLYIARNQTNIGGMKRATQARFVDEDGSYDPPRPLENLENDPVLPMSPIRRSGTLSGLASGRKNMGVLVCGAAYHREHEETIYSSIGPSAGAKPARAGVDYFMPADESRALDGIRAAGTHSGQSVRVTGTSFAAPQLARWVVNQP